MALSSKQSRTLPAISNQNEIIQILQTWRTRINDALSQPSAPGGVPNFKATAAQGGIQLTWSQTQGADGYILYVSTSSNFASGVTEVHLRGVAQTKYFDSVGQAAVTRYYKIAATSGSTNQPQSVLGAQSGIQSATTQASTGASTASQITGVLQPSQGGTGTNNYNTGDLIVGFGGTLAVLDPVGTNGQVLVADNTQPLGVRWGSAGQPTIGLVIDGGGGVPTAGSKGYIQIPFACTITGWTILARQAGSAQITIKKSSYAGFPSTTSIVASLPPKLTSQQNNTSTTLTGWTTVINAGDVLEFNLDSILSITWLILELQVSKN